MGPRAALRSRFDGGYVSHMAEDAVEIAMRGLRRAPSGDALALDRSAKGLLAEYLGTLSAPELLGSAQDLVGFAYFLATEKVSPETGRELLEVVNAFSDRLAAHGEEGAELAENLAGAMRDKYDSFAAFADLAPQYQEPRETPEGAVKADPLLRFRLGKK